MVRTHTRTAIAALVFTKHGSEAPWPDISGWKQGQNRSAGLFWLQKYQPPIPTEGEFLELVSRGKLSHPPSDLFDLSMYYYSFFKSRKLKCCQKIFLEAYKEIYISTDYYFDKIDAINRRFSNCFFKAFVKKECSAIKNDEQKKKRMKRKLDNWCFNTKWLTLFSFCSLPKHQSELLWLSSSSLLLYIPFVTFILQSLLISVVS